MRPMKLDAVKAGLIAAFGGYNKVLNDFLYLFSC